MSYAEQSHVNMVDHYKPELTQMITGTPAVSLFSYRTRKNLLRLGILNLQYRLGGKRIIVSKESLQLLEGNNNDQTK